MSLATIQKLVERIHTDHPEWDGERVAREIGGVIAKTSPYAVLVPRGLKRLLVPDWCRCGSLETFHSYPEDGTCTCGMHKHHVHCATCGGVSQIG